MMYILLMHNYFCVNHPKYSNGIMGDKKIDTFIVYIYMIIVVYYIYVILYYILSYIDMII